MSFSILLKEARKKQNLKQIELAKLLNVSDKTISSWETGRSYPDITQVKIISKILNIPLNIILDLDNFNVNVKEISREELKEKENIILKFKKKMIIIDLLTFMPIIIPIMLLITQNIYEISKNSNILTINSYNQIFTIIKIILLSLSTFTHIYSMIIFIITAYDYKDKLDIPNNTRASHIYFKYANFFVCSFVCNSIIIFLFIFNSELTAIILELIGFMIYIFLSIISLKKLNLKIEITKKNILYYFIFILIFLIIGVVTSFNEILSLVLIGIYFLYYFTSYFLKSII